MRSSPNDDLRLIGEVKATTDRIADKMGWNLDQVCAAVRRMDKERVSAWQDLQTLVEDVLEDLRHFKQLIVDPGQLEFDCGLDEPGVDYEACVEPSLTFQFSLDEIYFDSDNEPTETPAQRVVEEPIRKVEIGYLCAIDGSGLADQQPQVTLLKRTQKNLEDLVETIDSRFRYDVFLSLEKVERESKIRRQDQQDNREVIKREFSGLQEALKRLLKAHRGQSGLEVKY